jgi:hypothetical protein
MDVHRLERDAGLNFLPACGTSKLPNLGPLWSPCPRSSACRVPRMSAVEKLGAKIQARFFPGLNPVT